MFKDKDCRVGLIIGLTIILGFNYFAFPNFDPRQNVWVTLACQLNTTSFCASLATPQSPFITCLVGVPASEGTWPVFQATMNCTQEQFHTESLCPTKTSLVACLSDYDTWDDHLPVGPDSQELNLVVSLNATYCFWMSSLSVELALQKLLTRHGLVQKEKGAYDGETVQKYTGCEQS